MSRPTKNSTENQYRVPNELAQEYLSVNEGIKFKPSTVRTYDDHLTDYNRFLQNNGLNVLSAEFTDVLEFIEECVRRKNRKSTISGKLTVVSELYCYIRLRTDASEELELDPLRFREIEIDDYNTPEEIEREALSRKEIRLLFDACNSYRNRLMTIVGVETGIRNSDIRNLRIEDINGNTLHIHDPKNSNPYNVPISEQLAFELDWWIRNHRKGFAASENSEYVFVSQQGEKLESNGSLNSIIKEAAERAGIQEVIARTPIRKEQKQDIEKDYREWHRVTVHTLRHSCISLLEEAGVSLQYRQLVANHANPETTLRYSQGGKEVIFNSIRESYDPPR